MLFHEKVAYNYFHKLFDKPKKKLVLGDAYHILNEYEQKQIRQIRFQALFYAGLFGMLGVVLLYLPLQLFPSLFPSFDISLAWVGKVQVPWAYTLYMVLLAVLEIFGLTWLNLVIVHAISRVCRFPTPDDERYQEHIQILFEVSLDKNNTQQLRLGINPLAGLSPTRILIFSTLFMLKATLTNIFVKFIFRRLFTRWAILPYLDYVSVLVFSAWNMYATHLVVNAVKIRVMAPNLIYQLTERLHHEFKSHDSFKEILLEVLQFIAVAKRNFHHNHYLLAESIINAFELPRLPEIKVEQEALLIKLRALPTNLKQGMAKLFVLGLLIDGSISWREKRATEILMEQNLWQVNVAELKAWASDFKAGKGLDKLFQHGVKLI